MKKTIILYMTFAFMLMPFAGCGRVMNKLGNVNLADVDKAGNVVSISDPISNVKEEIRWKEYVIGAGIGFGLALISRACFHYLRPSLPPPHTVIQQFENTLTTFDIAFRMFIPEEIRTRVYQINSQNAAEYSGKNTTENTFSELLNLFGNTYSILVDSGGYTGLQSFCLNSFET